MSHRHYWAKIEYQGAALAGMPGVHRAAARNTEKLSLIVPTGSRSSSLGDLDERIYEKSTKKTKYL